MAHFVPERRELTATLVVFGASRAGKTAVLHCIHDRVTPERRMTPVPFGLTPGASPLLDWLSLDLGTISGWRTRVHLYAVPGQRHADNTRRLVLADADGVLFVADSQAERLAENVAALRGLRESLQSRDEDRRDPPMVFLYTKRDLPEELLLDPSALNAELNARGVPAFACDALHGVGVLEALHAAVTLVMRQLAPARGPDA